MFIHFGAYSNLEGEADYEQQAATFNPAGFDAEAIAQAAQDAGQKYVVITSKHHEGYAVPPPRN